MMDWTLSVQSDIARLPALVWQQGWLSAGWSLMMAWLGAWSTRRWAARQGVKLALSLGLAAWVWLPGSWGGAYWLGLAFQAPSVTSVLFCAFVWGRTILFPALSYQVRKMWPPHMLFLALCGVALGWGLLLDTLGVWPTSLYNWGFGAAAPAIALVIAALPWIKASKRGPSQSVVLLASTTLIFLVLRLPTGNLFDALIDPWLWCFLQFALIQQWRHRAKPVSA